MKRNKKATKWKLAAPREPKQVAEKTETRRIRKQKPKEEIPQPQRLEAEQLQRQPHLILQQEQAEVEVSYDGFKKGWCPLT